DEYEFESILSKRFGEGGRKKLMDLYRSNFITPRDFAVIRTFGFNVVRVPFEYALIEDAKKPGSLDREGIRWLDRAVNMARNAKMYVILDMHGAPGRQSLDHTTGRAGQNHLWSDESCQARTVNLWKSLAARYRDSSTVLGYDLINEPFGDTKTEKHQPALVALMDRVYKGIRSVDTNHIVIFPGTHAGIEFYGKPSDREWENVAFTEHYYPGLFGDKPELDSHARFIGLQLPGRAAYLESVQAPLLAGEFNAVFKRLDAPALMRRYYDEYTARGWAATMWAYKLLHKEGGADGDYWGMVANRDPLPTIDYRRATADEIASYFQGLGTMDYDINDALREQLTAVAPRAVALTAYEWIGSPPANESIPGWFEADINGARPGGQRRLSSHGVEVYGGGSDIWKNSDQFRFVFAEATGDVRIAARIDALVDTHPHAKAGLMLRNTDAPDSAHVLLHVFPDGRLCVGWREREGAVMKEKEVARLAFPIFVELERHAHALRGRYSTDGQTWQDVPLPDTVQLRPQLGVGLAVLSHNQNNSLTRAVFEEIGLER
ncbi:MAG TPA: cellulase family glycosylhydrolase, partial [Kiritimatiellia bacterium]